jgi:hypothetical protein
MANPVLNRLDRDFPKNKSIGTQNYKKIKLQNYKKRRRQNNEAIQLTSNFMFKSFIASKSIIALSVTSASL